MSLPNISLVMSLRHIPDPHFPLYTPGYGVSTYGTVMPSGSATMTSCGGLSAVKVNS